MGGFIPLFIALALWSSASVQGPEAGVGTGQVSDIDYFYTSRLPGESLAGVADIHSHPALRRSIRVGLHVGV